MLLKNWMSHMYPGLEPLHKGFKAAQQLLDFDKSKTVMVGDQLLADILGANTFGVRTIIVKPRKAMLGKQKSIVSLKKEFL